MFTPFLYKILNLFSKRNEARNKKQVLVSLNIIEGITKENNHLICAFAGNDHIVMDYWGSLLFKESTSKHLGDIHTEHIKKLLRTKYPDCSLLLVQHDQKNVVLKKYNKKAFVLANYIQSYIDISKPIDLFPSKVKRHFSNTRRRINKSNLTFEMTKSLHAQKDFYHNYYLPYIGERHKKSCMLLRFEDIFSPIVPFDIIQIKKENEIISAGVVFYKKDYVSCAFLGVKRGQVEYVKMGGLAAIYYFLVTELYKLGYSKLFLGGAPPILSHNLTHHKIRMNAKHDTDFDYCNNKFTAFHVLELSKAVREILTMGPYVFQTKNGEMNGAIWLGRNQFSAHKDFIKCCRLLLNYGMKKNYIFELDKNPVPENWYRELPKNSFDIVKSKKTSRLFFNGSKMS